ncbi:MAG TPA: class I SAM-dependent methyltransferase [Pseudonocardiaceae bacterium]|nr:class I SAM-dependent methyltransferase [Pseudonocardiaceae bacterium]
MDEGPQNWGAPLIERVLHRAGVGRGTLLLDLGCGAGRLCRIAADRGAQVTGIDRDARQIKQAVTLVPEGIFDVGDILALPYPAARFDAVTCVQSIMHVSNPLTALREAARVARPAAPVVVTVWGKEENCDIRAFGQALSGLLPRAAGQVPGVHPPQLSDDGRLERLAQLAGIAVMEVGDVKCPFWYPNEHALLRGLLGSGLGRRALGVASPGTVRRAVLEGLARYRTPTGGYRLDNSFRYLVGSSPQKTDDPSPGDTTVST